MKKLLLLCLLTITCISAYGQTGTISGKVMTEDKTPLPYVNIVVEGINLSGTTDMNGAFTLNNVPVGDQTIIFAAFAFDSLTKHVVVKSGETTNLTAIMNPSVLIMRVITLSTSSRVSEDITEVPSSVTFISKEELERQTQINMNLPDILMLKVPGMSPSEESQNNFAGKIRGRDALVLIDGIPQTTPLRNGGRDLKSIDPQAIEQIEVIHGASAMYGNGGAGGIINYITKKAPTNDPFSSTTFVRGSLNLVKAKGTGDFNLAQTFTGTVKSIDYVVLGKYGRTGVRRSADGEVISPFYGLGETDTYNGLVKLGYNISKNHRLELMGNYYRSIQDSKHISTTGDYGVSPAIGIKGDSAVNGGTPYNKTLSLKYLGKLKKTDVVLSAYYNDFNTVFETFNQIYSTNKGIRLYMNTPFKLGEKKKLSLIYGMDVLTDYTAQKKLDDSFVTPDMNMSSIAPYLQSKLSVKDWIIRAGARFENIGLNVNDLEGIPGESDRYNAFVVNAGVRFNKLSYLQPFASYSQGYSIGDIGLILRNGVPLSAIDAKPVLVDNIEAGFSGKYKFVNYELAGYFSYSERGTRFKEVSSGVYSATQLPQKIYGLELVLSAKPKKWLKVNTTLSYMDGKEDPDNDGSWKGEIDNSNVSPLKVTASTDFQVTKKLNVLLQMVKIGSRDVFSPDQYNYARYPITGYTLFDLYASYKHKNLQFNLSVNNLLNADYYPVYSEIRGANYGSRYYVKGRGTTANLGVTISL